MALVSPRRAMWLSAAGRMALGTAVMIAPERIVGHWLGKENAASAAVQDLGRGLAARDIALGFATLQTLDDAVLGPRILAACAVADTVDTIATIVARRHLPRAGVIATVAIAGGTAAAGFYCSHKLAHA
jgi:hypothetical protein